MNSRSNIEATSASVASDSDTRWDLVIRISESQRFAKSLRLREFLLYVCRSALDSHVNEISEQKIGERVFHRAPDYNPNEDNIVRSQARLLRQKLEAYFATEGIDEPVILRIPKGGYVPEFIDRPIEPVSVVQPISIGLAPARNNLVHWLVAAVGILSFAVAVLAIETVRAKSATPAIGTSSHALNALWSQLLNEKAPTTIIVPDHTYAMLQESAGEREELQGYLNRQTPGDNTGHANFRICFRGSLRAATPASTRSRRQSGCCNWRISSPATWWSAMRGMSRYATYRRGTRY